MNTRSGKVAAVLVFVCVCGLCRAEEPSGIHALTRAGDANQIQAVLQATPGAASLQDQIGRTPLHYAAIGNRAEIIEQLLAAGADVNTRDVLGETALHMTARRFRKEAAEILIAAGADVHAKNEKGMTPLLLAASTGPDSLEVDRLLSSLAEVLIAAGANVNAADADGATALDHALRRNHNELATLLREQGAKTTGPAIQAQPRVTGYTPYADIGPILLTHETNYPAICKRYDLGLSEQGRHLWAIRISDNMPTEEDEPEFRYTSSMHGDEILGIEMCLELIDYLLTNYGSDSQVDNLVDELDIWIVPLVNPDGYDRASPIRNNANGVNLNRDFPDPFTSPNNTTVGRAAETAAIMNWGFANSFALAANFHGGATVVNYPFDNNPSGSSVFTPSPDEDLFVFISKEYSVHNTPLWNSPSFQPFGITNGAEWYAISGGEQDWSYRYMGCNEVTIELNDNKMPSFTLLPGFWNDNRDSMMAYMETALIGVRGVVTDELTSAPVLATVTVTGRDHEVYTDPDVGDYHRMLLPGNYELTFEAPGYDTLTYSGVVVGSGAATRLDVAMAPIPSVQYPNGGEILNTGVPTNITWTGSPSAAFQVQYAANFGSSTSDLDDFERSSLGSDYITGGNVPWSTTTAQAHSGIRSARAGAIGSSQVSWMVRNVGSGDLSFWYRLSTESGGDYLNFYVGGNQLIHASGSTGWTFFSAELTAGSNTLLWEYVKDSGGVSGSDTVWIDELSIVEDFTVWNDVIALTAPGADSTSWTPPFAGTQYGVRVRANYGGSTYGVWDECDAVFSVEDSPFVPGDLDGDGDVDLNDFLTFAGCFSGSGGTVPPGGCSGAEFSDSDLDGDNDVDLNDFLTFATNFGG